MRRLGPALLMGLGLVTGCGGGTRPRDMGRYETLRNDPDGQSTATQLPKMTAEADAIFASAEAAQDAGRPQDAAHLARLARYALWRAEAWAARKTMQNQLSEASNRLRLLDVRVAEARRRERTANEQMERAARLTDYETRIAALGHGPSIPKLQLALEALRSSFANDSGRLAPADEVQARKALEAAMAAASGAADAMTLADRAVIVCNRLLTDVAPRHVEERARAAADARLRVVLAHVADVPEIEARIEARGLVLTVRQLFADGTNEIMPHRLSLIDATAELLRDVADMGIRVEGHTEVRSDEAAAVQTSAGRAEAVRSRLLHDGLPEASIAATGRGGADPIADSNTRDGRTRNHRIEIIVLRLQSKR